MGSKETVIGLSASITASGLVPSTTVGQPVGAVGQGQNLHGEAISVLDDPVLRDPEPGVLADLAEPVRALAPAAGANDFDYQVELRSGYKPGGFVDDGRAGDVSGNDEHVGLAYPGGVLISHSPPSQRTACDPAWAAARSMIRARVRRAQLCRELAALSTSHPSSSSNVYRPRAARAGQGRCTGRTEWVVSRAAFGVEDA